MVPNSVYRLRTLCYLGLLCLLAMTPAIEVSYGQEVGSSSFGESIVVDLVNVEVWVTDREGQPVRGLTASDFEVFEDGRPVTVSHFREIATSTTDLSTPPAPEVTQPQAFVPEIEPDTSDAGHLVVYLDELHLRVGGRKRLIRDLRRFLEQTAVPASQILIVRQGQGLTAENLFGSSLEQVEAAVDRLLEATPQSTMAQQQKWLTLERLQTTWQRLKESARGGALPCGEFVATATPEIEAYGRESEVRVRLTLDHLSSMISFLAGVPGVKTLLYLSDSLEMGPGEDLLRFVTDLCPTTRRQTTPVALGAAMSTDFQRLTRHASANRVTIYALQPEGLRAGFVGSAQQRTVDMSGMRALQSAVRNNERDGLSYVAYETGGRAVFNQNSLLGELRNIDAEISNYYSLAYEPPRSGSGVEHRVEVRVRGDHRVRHRRGYRVKSRDEVMEERLQGAQYLGLVSNPLEVRLAAGGAIPAGKRSHLRLHVVIPSDRLVFLPAENGAKATVAVLVQAYRPNGRLEAREQKLFLVAEPPPDSSDSVDLLVELPLGDGVFDIVVGVRDDTSNQASYVSTALGVSRSESDQSRR